MFSDCIQQTQIYWEKRVQCLPSLLNAWKPPLPGDPNYANTPLMTRVTALINRTTDWSAIIRDTVFVHQDLL